MTDGQADHDAEQQMIADRLAGLWSRLALKAGWTPARNAVANWDDESSPKGSTVHFNR